MPEAAVTFVKAPMPCNDRGGDRHVGDIQSLPLITIKVPAAAAKHPHTLRTSLCRYFLEGAVLPRRRAARTYSGPPQKTLVYFSPAGSS